MKKKEGVIKKIIVTGFDEEMPPVLRVLEDGTTFLIFEIFPPDDKLTEHQLDNFEQLLSEVAGVKVTQDDRELFIINSNDLQVVDKVKKYLESL